MPVSNTATINLSNGQPWLIELDPMDPANYSEAYGLDCPQCHQTVDKKGACACTDWESENHPPLGNLLVHIEAA